MKEQPNATPNGAEAEKVAAAVMEDLDALRGRADFKALLTELTAPKP